MAGERARDLTCSGALVPARTECEHKRMDGLARPDVTQLLARGVTRLLMDHALSPLLEVPLANGRRADIMAITGSGEIWIVETKSCLADYACDAKWPDYIEYCDRFFFGVTEEFPRDLIPEECGLIVADGFGGAVLRDSPVRTLNAARRKAVTLLFARIAAQRLAFLSSTP